MKVTDRLHKGIHDFRNKSGLDAEYCQMGEASFSMLLNEIGMDFPELVRATNIMGGDVRTIMFEDCEIESVPLVDGDHMALFHTKPTP